MSASPNAIRPNVDPKRGSRPNVSSMLEGRASPTSFRTPVRKTPIVYPALLSRVAQAFRDRIPITDRVKDGLTYKDAFDGREAVDKIAYVIKTTDRNLALLLGRALDAQKFFHDVTYDHRLRDSANELYQFRTILPSPFVSGEFQGEDAHVNKPDDALFNSSHPYFEVGCPIIWFLVTFFLTSLRVVPRPRHLLHHHIFVQGRTLFHRTSLHYLLGCLPFLRIVIRRHVPGISYVTVSHVRGG